MTFDISCFISEIEKIHPNADMAVNIGLVPNAKTKKISRKIMRQIKAERNIEDLERKSRLNQCKYEQ